MNNFELIKAVRARKPLWDKSTWDKVDVVTREELWIEVATRMDVPSTYTQYIPTLSKNIVEGFVKSEVRGKNADIQGGIMVTSC